MHDEPCNYYSFGCNKAEAELNAYQVLKRIGINTPRLIGYDLKTQYLVKEYIEGITATTWLIDEKSLKPILPQLFRMSAIAKKNGYNIDYFPPNFVINNQTS